MNTIKITEIKTIQDALKVYSAFKKLDNTQKVLFDFSGARFIYSNYTALLGALIESCESFEIAAPRKEKVKTVLSKNNFLPTFTESPKLNDTSQSVIEYERFALYELEKQNIFFEKLLEDNILKTKGLTNLSDKVLKNVSRNIIELFDNAREHSKSVQGIHIAGQFFPQKHKFDFTIVDMGLGIVTNVNSFLDEKLQAGEAINWAMTKQNSTRVGEPGGLGLALLKELIMKSNGTMEIISNSGYYFIKNQKESYKTLDVEFEGTIINIEFNIDEKKYFFKEELEK
ncbi:MAG: ATP-binding protein [Campylobacterota bacterium]|nr:ATP-binding protein [Campylobacterota bacterium]